MDSTQHSFLKAHRSAIFLILGIIGLRWLWHSLGPIGMAGDETYYWLWGQYPDWGYYSKPPLIGWIYGALTALFGAHTWVFKAFATLLGGGTLWFFYRTLETLTHNRSLAFLGLLTFALLPAHLLLSSMLTIDAPLLFCWTGALFCTVKILDDPEPRTFDFVCLAGLLALGHLSKQMMLVQLPLILIVTGCFKRTLLRDRRLWIALLGSLLALLPPVVWNAQNEWITFQHTAHHFEPAPPTLGKTLSRLGDFWGVVCILVSPILFVLLFPSIAYAWKNRKDRAVALCILFGVIGLIVMSLLTYRQRINPNWPAAFLPASLALILLWANASALRMVWFKRGIWVAGFLSLGAMIFLSLLEPLAPQLAKLGLPPQKRGWQGYPEMVQQTVQQFPQAEQIIFVGHRFIASQFAFHGSDPKRVHLWNPTQSIQNQFDFFNAPEIGLPTLIVVEREQSDRSGALPEALIPLLKNPEAVNELPMHPHRDYPRYKIYLAESLEDWISHSH